LITTIFLEQHEKIEEKKEKKEKKKNADEE
jgi:hypothetical protein